MRARFPAARLVATLALALVLAEPAAAADPVMPLRDVRAGMLCTGLSVVRGTEVTGFAVEVIDVVDGEPAPLGPRILVRVSGPAVDDTGVGPGFSGSPIVCPDAAGVQRIAGAISEAVGEYGGKVVLATPIEAILGTPVNASGARPARGLLRRARPLVLPLTVTGLRPALGARLQEAAAAHGRALLATPAGPLGSFPPQGLRPGAALGVSFSTGALAVGAVGTVSYVDGTSVWGFGHSLEGLGRRALFLQDAYVFRVVNHPFGLPGIASTYKMAATGHVLGTLTNDAPAAVAGRLGGAPPRIPVRIRAADLDASDARTFATDVADETNVDQPSGSSALSFVAPVAVLQATSTILEGAPARLTGTACFTLRLREYGDPLRFCNRYVTDMVDPTSGGDAVGGLAASDLQIALGLIDAYTVRRIHVTDVSARVSIARGMRLAYLQKVELPARVRAGATVPATLVLRHVRGPLERRNVRLQMPSDLRPGARKVRLTGTDVDFGLGLLSDFGAIFDDESLGDGSGPQSLDALARAVRRIGRYDGVRIAPADDEEDGKPAYRADDIRIAGTAPASVRVLEED